jgi:predicted neutral ceramidase superfamily lipid hydrolase
VRGILWKNRRIFIYLALIYAFLTITLVGIASQDSYTQLGETIRETSQQIFKGNTEGLAEASVLMLTSVTGKLNNVTSEAQQIYGVLIGLLAWLTTVWLLRAITSGQKPKLRDALYSAGAPILPTFAIALVVVVQLLPIAVAVIAYAAANTSGLLEGGIETMLFWTFALLLGSMSLYWITSTLIALAIVTLPGMYPLRAVKAAGDIVIGRRIRILLRLLWMAFLIAIVWIIVMLPVVLFDSWLRGVVSGIEWLPLVPIAMLIMGTITVIWTASYIYLLYRKVVDDDAAPA